MTTRAHAALLIAVPLAFSVLLWFHPMLSDYEDLLGVTARFQIVHLAMVLVVPLLAVGLHVMLDGVNGRAATVARLSLIPFVAFYAPYVAFEGIAVGVLGQELNGLPAAQRDAIAPGMIEDFARNPIIGEPSLFWALGTLALLIAVVSAVLALRRSGAPAAFQLLLGGSALIGTHAPPLAPIGLVCFAAAGWMALRARESSGAPIVFRRAAA
jgi:hypothetical protein